MSGKAKYPAWSELKRRLKNWGEPELLGLVQDLYELEAGNRDFLAARLLRKSVPLADEGWTASPLSAGSAADDKVLDPFRRRIDRGFYAKDGLPATKLNLADGRKAIRDYRKATADLAGTVELMVHYVETGTAFTLDFGDIDESFYNSLCAVLDEIEKAFKTADGRMLYACFRDRFLKLRERTYNKIGWGYGDYVEDLVAKLENTIGESGTQA